MSGMKEYKCPACGGAVEFNSASQKMICPYCDTEFSIEAFEAEEQEVQDDKFQWNTEDKPQWDSDETQDMGIYICKSCGGEIIADETTGAIKCPYCDSPIVLEGNFAGDLKPDYIIPFKLDKKAAKAALQNYFRKKVLLPKVFKEENHLEEIKGLYVPVWLFDAKATADARFKATKIRKWSDSEYDYTETRFYDVYRSGNMTVQNVPVDGSSKMPDDMMESIEPFLVEEAQEFKKAYLAGYMADRYDVGMEESIGRANERLKCTIEKELQQSVHGYASVIPEKMGVKVQNGTAKYALYPVWVLNTRWENKLYTFIMNGQTGKLVGNLPIDKGAFWKLFGLHTVGLTAVFYILINLLFMVLY